MLRQIGGKAFLIALVGSVGPVTIGFALATAMGAEWQPALACGMTLGPTSMGIALNVLKSGGVLETETGQLIITAAVIDDVLALIILSILQALANPTPMGFIRPVLSSALWIGIGGGIALFIVPGLMRRFMDRVPERHQQNLTLAVLLTVSIACTAAAKFTYSSYLLGSFIGGLCFAHNQTEHDVWVHQVKRITSWLLRLFFGGTVAFVVPIKSFTSPKVIWQGCFLLVALLGKLATGFLAQRPLTCQSVLTVGWSMSAWGEFAFIVATTAAADGIIDTGTPAGRDLFASVLLAVLLSTVISPFALKMVLSHFVTKHSPLPSSDPTPSAPGGGAGVGPAQQAPSHTRSIAYSASCISSYNMGGIDLGLQRPAHPAERVALPIEGVRLTQLPPTPIPRAPQQDAGAAAAAVSGVSPYGQMVPQHTAPVGSARCAKGEGTASMHHLTGAQMEIDLGRIDALQSDPPQTAPPQLASPPPKAANQPH